MSWLRLPMRVGQFAREQVCGVVRYVPMNSVRRSSAGSGAASREQSGHGKRKAHHALDGIVSQHELNAWLVDMGDDADAMLEELLSVDSSDEARMLGGGEM